MIRQAFDSLRQRFRQRRYLQIQDLMGIGISTGFILDLGGGPASFFAAMFPRPERIILLDVNYGLASHSKQRQPALHAIVADGRRLPLADCSIDMTICNSVIEHITTPKMLASEIRRVSQSYFLQTPNGDFPLETHSFIAIPFYNFVPWIWLRRFVSKVFGADFDYVNDVGYLPEARLKTLFPEARIAYEKVFGLKKSFYIYYRNKNMQ
jgi:ubiquinone/menaquinone biosynthesis C-methylase UbiE